MSYIWETPDPIKAIKLERPKFDVEEIMDGAQVNYVLKSNLKVKCEIADTLDNEICKAILDTAEREGVTDLFLIDKEFIMTAIKNEMARRKGEEI